MSIIMQCLLLCSVYYYAMSIIMQCPILCHVDVVIGRNAPVGAGDRKNPALRGNEIHKFGAAGQKITLYIP